MHENMKEYTNLEKIDLINRIEAHFLSRGKMKQLNKLPAWITEQNLKIVFALCTLSLALVLFFIAQRTDHFLIILCIATAFVVLLTLIFRSICSLEYMISFHNCMLDFFSDMRDVVLQSDDLAQKNLDETFRGLAVSYLEDLSDTDKEIYTEILQDVNHEIYKSKHSTEEEIK